ncbi:DUF1800 domain-containing protein [Nocardioides iriomotensis]|uniref:DUF1800 domain-containing protein n=1 Tax=Nocardioides iriomotensis TaxID=715784 RepID=A0A4Q5J160_9ACTN|nr:DUF1800 domain-containing protein [Nocardioides iriomotensis]RYU12260.1 DUF1800 domain-containing protein [Nocardioides iriomotensis]
MARKVNPYPDTKVPTAQQRHFMNRLGCGYSRSTFKAMRKAGSPEAWFEKQLRPEKVKEAKLARKLPYWYGEARTDSPVTKWSKQAQQVKGGWEYALDLANYSLLRRIHSERQVLENLVDFWSNHLHVGASSDLGWVHRWSYDETIRRHALGRFDEMLADAALHPSMLLFLDNWRSVRGAPNENQGRELLELHTVGRAAGYTEQMVKDSAKILSGWTVDAFKTWDRFYDPAKHTTGPVQVLGFTAGNTSADAQETTKDYLRYLAHHPATAHNIARKLAVRFVSDTPSTRLVNDLAKVFRKSGTDIKATMRALVAHPEFKKSKGNLVRTPLDDFVATARALDIRVLKPAGDDAFARVASWAVQSTPAYHWPRPDGSPWGGAQWTSPARMLGSFRMHWNLGAGWWPSKGVKYKDGAAFLPEKQIRLDAWVDHLCREILGRESSPRIVDAVCTTVGYGGGEKVTKDHQAAGWMFVRILGVLLDSPDHMHR